jgi:TatD DNase family protein
MKYIDIHAHLNFEAFKNDLSEVIQRTNSEDMGVINVGTKYETSLGAMRLAHENENMYAIIGLHPIHVNPSFHDADEIGIESKPFKSKGEDFDRTKYMNLLESAKENAKTDEQDGKFKDMKWGKIVAVGECGLDYFHIPDNVADFKDRQKKAFREQIEFAIDVDLPIMIHCRDAYDDVLEILKEYKDELHQEGGEELAKKLRGDIHFFAGTKEQAHDFLNLGFDVSFTGVATFAKQYEELIEFVPIDRIHAETDSPYVAPAPYRGKRNEPVYVDEVIKKMAEIKGVSVNDMKKQLIENSERLFGIKNL